MFNKSTSAKQIESLKAVRKQAVTRFEQLSRLKNEELAEYFYCKFQEGQDVPYELLMVVPENKALALPVVRGGVIITSKIDHSHPDVSRFITSWTAGSTLTWHYHSNARELIIVNKGCVKVYSDKKTTILNVGDQMHIAPGIGHQITALEETELEVDFLRVDNL